MVRLKREIDGLRIDPSMPEPTYALHPRASRAVLPTFDRQVRSLEGARVLMAGLPQLELAVALAESGHQVTLTDLPNQDVSKIHAQLSRETAGRMNLVNKPYGETIFAPSSFDAAVWLDMLHAYPQGRWLMHKIHRELKIDGLLHARLFVRGSLPEITTKKTPPTQLPAAPMCLKTALKLASVYETMGRHPAATLLLSRRGREAIDRGVHLSPTPFATEARDQFEAISASMRIEEVQAGHTLRLRLASLLFGLREPARHAILACLEKLPELADLTDRASLQPRTVFITARKSLMDMGRNHRH